MAGEWTTSGTGEPDRRAEEDEVGRVDPNHDAAERLLRCSSDRKLWACQVSKRRTRHVGAGAQRARPPRLASDSSHADYPDSSHSSHHAARRSGHCPSPATPLAWASAAMPIGFVATRATTASTGSVAPARAMCAAGCRCSAAGVVVKWEAITPSGVPAPIAVRSGCRQSEHWRPVTSAAPARPPRRARADGRSSTASRDRLRGSGTDAPCSMRTSRPAPARSADRTRGAARKLGRGVDRAVHFSRQLVHRGRPATAWLDHLRWGR